MYEDVLNTELYHHGIKGQKWGIRRYQNPDGSLTDAGKRRYGGTTLTSGELQALKKQAKKEKKKHEKEIDKRIKRDNGFSVSFNSADNGEVYIERYFDSRGIDYSMNDIKEWEKRQGRRNLKKALALVGGYALVNVGAYASTRYIIHSYEDG